MSISSAIERIQKMLLCEIKNRDARVLGKSRISVFQKHELTLLKILIGCPLPRDYVFLIKIFSNVFCEKGRPIWQNVRSVKQRGLKFLDSQEF